MHRSRCQRCFGVTVGLGRVPEPAMSTRRLLDDRVGGPLRERALHADCQRIAPAHVLVPGG